MSSFRSKIEDTDLEIEQQGFKKDKLLRDAGWKHTSATPGCLWLWTREIPGYGKIMVDRESAIWIEQWQQENSGL